YDRSLFTREPARILLLRDDLRDVGREVALEVRQHQRFAPHLLRALRVLDRDRGERPERDQELEVVVREGVRRREVVHVEDADPRPSLPTRTVRSTPLSGSRSTSCCLDTSSEMSSSSSAFFAPRPSSHLAVTWRGDAPAGPAATPAGPPPDTLPGSGRTIVPPA